MQLLGVTAETRSNEDAPHFPDHLEIFSAVDHDGFDLRNRRRDHSIVPTDRPIARIVDVDSEEPETATGLLSQPPRTLPHSAGEHQHIDPFE